MNEIIESSSVEGKEKDGRQMITNKRATKYWHSNMQIYGCQSACISQRYCKVRIFSNNFEVSLIPNH